MYVIQLNQIEEKEFIKGFWVRFVHSENMTMAHWRIEEGHSLPDHAHPHEQVVNLIEGTFELTIDGVSHVLEAPAVAVVPSNVRHSGKALTKVRIIDAFYPAREDYKNK